jgi:oxalate decarboxylase
MTVFASAGKARTFDYQAGDVGYVPFAMGHHIENTGDEPLRFLEMFRSGRFADISLNQWMALTPAELVQSHLNLDGQTMAALSRDKPVIVKPDDAQHPQLDSLPFWPSATIAVLSTIGRSVPHTIPVTAPLRVGARRILLALKRDRGSLIRLRDHPDVALTIVNEGDEAFTARGRARVVEEPMARAPEFAAVMIDVDEIDDHRQRALTVETGVGVRWLTDSGPRDARERLAALHEIAARERSHAAGHGS